MPEVNDAQSRLNPTHVKSILSPRSEEEVRKAILRSSLAIIGATLVVHLCFPHVTTPTLLQINTTRSLQFSVRNQR